MTPEEKKFITKNLSELISNTNLKPGTLLALLLQTDLTEEEKQSIESNVHVNEHQRCYEFYRIMQMKENGFISLMRAFKVTKQTQAFAILQKFFIPEETAALTFQPHMEIISIDKINPEKTITSNNVSVRPIGACQSQSELLTQLLDITEKLGKEFVINFLLNSGLPDFQAKTKVEEPHIGTNAENVFSLKCLSEVNCLQFDKTKLLSGHKDGKIKIWDWYMKTTKCTDTLNGHDGKSVWSLHFNDKFIASSGEGCVIIWDIETLKIIYEFERKDEIFSKVWLTKSHLVALYRGGSGGKIYSLNIQDSNDIHLEAEAKTHHSSLAMHVADEYVITGGWNDKRVKVWQFGTLKHLRDLNGHESSIWRVSYSNKHIVSGDGKHIRLWNIDSGKCLRVFNVGYSPLCDLVCDDFRLVTGHEDGRVYIWKMDEILNPDSSDPFPLNTLSITPLKVSDICLHEQLLMVSSNDRIKCFKFIHE